MLQYLSELHSKITAVIKFKTHIKKSLSHYKFICRGHRPISLTNSVREIRNSCLVADKFLLQCRGQHCPHRAKRAGLNLCQGFQSWALAPRGLAVPCPSTSGFATSSESKKKLLETRAALSLQIWDCKRGSDGLVYGFSEDVSTIDVNISDI